MLRRALANERFAHPGRGVIPGIVNALVACNSLHRLRRWCMQRLPFVQMASDVKDVVYLNWIVDVSDVAALVPRGIELWQRQGKTVLTVLTYRHGHFGPAAAGKLRGLMPSPLQSNWRLYLQDSRDCRRPVLFLKNIMDSALYALGTRLASDVMLTHLAAVFEHHCDARGCSSRIEAGEGSAPALRYAAKAGECVLPDVFAALFQSWDEAVDFLCLREGAYAIPAEGSRLAVSGIELPIDLATVRPLTLQAGSFASPSLAALVRDHVPMCFMVPEVEFKVLWERLVPQPVNGD